MLPILEWGNFTFVMKKLGAVAFRLLACSQLPQYGDWWTSGIAVTGRCAMLLLHLRTRRFTGDREPKLDVHGLPINRFSIVG